MKDIFEAIDSRIKSPVFGYFILSMLALNWQPIFFLLFDDGSVIDRIAYFDEHTSAETLFVLPLIFTALYPWLQYAFTWINSKPHELKRGLHNTAEHTDIMKKQKLAQERKEYEETLVSGVIERAKTDQQVTEEFEDKETREKVQSEIESIRQNQIPSKDKLSKEQIEILKAITINEGAFFRDELINKLSFGTVASEYFIEDLINRNYLVSDNRSAGGKRFSLTTKGKKYAIDSGYV
jgi:hypothetical protein